MSQTPVCPYSGTHRKSERLNEKASPALEQDTHGVWHIRSYALARQILRDTETQQAGFKAELMNESPKLRPPILYQEGEEHKAQRTATAPFFTPKTTHERYRGLMEELSDRTIAQLKKERRVDLSDLTMTLAVAVAAKVVGLTDSLLPGMAGRIDAFFIQEDIEATLSWRPRNMVSFLKNQLRLSKFFLLDVQPAIRARRKEPQQDVISHLVGKGYNSLDILTECITFAAAGMATTREFISMAAWHLLEHPDLKAHYLQADEGKRQDILSEILRLEPVIGHLHRRTRQEIVLESGGQQHVLPAGTRLDLNIRAINADAEVVGAEPLSICPGRPLERGIQPPIMSFGDGHHRCPGAYIALQETDIFLTHFLRLEGLTIERPPSLSWLELVEGYELRDFIVRLA